MSGPIPNAQPLIVVAGQRGDGVDPESMRDALVSAAFALLTPEQMAEVVADRAIIEQAKGMLMVIYDIDADQAIDLLEWRSKQTRVHLRTFARYLTREFPTLAAGHRVPTRAEYDDILLTALQCTQTDARREPRPPLTD